MMNGLSVKLRPRTKSEFLSATRCRAMPGCRRRKRSADAGREVGETAGSGPVCHSRTWSQGLLSVCRKPDDARIGACGVFKNRRLGSAAA